MALSSFQAWQTPLLISTHLCLSQQEPLYSGAERRWNSLENRCVVSIQKDPVKTWRGISEVLIKEEVYLKGGYIQTLWERNNRIKASSFALCNNNNLLLLFALAALLFF